MAKKVLDSEEQEAVRSEQAQIPPRVQGDLLNIRRQLKSALSYIEAVLKQRGVKI
jgi:hypothetical protein